MTVSIGTPETREQSRKKIKQKLMTEHIKQFCSSTCTCTICGGKKFQNECNLHIHFEFFHH